MIQLLYDIKRVYAESHMVASFDNPHFQSCIDRCSEDTKITTAMHFVNMVYNPTTMDVVLHSVRGEAFILDIIVAVHDGLRLKNAILLNSKRNHGRQHFVRNCELIFSLTMWTLYEVTNHYKHFDSLLARMISIVDRVGDARRRIWYLETRLLLVRPIRLANIILIFSRRHPESILTRTPRTQDYDWPVDNAGQCTDWLGLECLYTLRLTLWKS
jgi:hypothetical protein